jgi:predicted Zn-dependent protease
MIMRVGQQARRILASAFLAGLALSPGLAWAIGPPDFKPGYNFYSPQDDVQVGRENSAQVDRQLPLLKDPEALTYLNGLGKRLVALAPNNHPEYSWQFRIVNSNEINAFALPGGYIYLNRGVFDAAENEAQLAGVIAHESGHVVMRHGTHIASEAVLAQGSPQGLVTPRTAAHQLLQTLCVDSQTRGHGLDRLALSRHQQALHIMRDGTAPFAPTQARHYRSHKSGELRNAVFPQAAIPFHALNLYAGRGSWSTFT